jgi:hypothetical protein
VTDSFAGLQATKPLAFAYWGVRRLCRELSDDGYCDWKALAFICLLEVLLVISAISFAAVNLGRSAVLWLIHWRLYGAVLVSVGVVMSNYYLLRHEDRWTRYEPEFNLYPRYKRVFGYAITGGIALLTMVLVLLTKHAFNAIARSAAP